MAGLRKLRGKYYARLKVRGRDKIISLNTTNEREAKIRLKEFNYKEFKVKSRLEDELDLGKIPTVSECKDEFIKQSKNKKLSYETIEHYQYAIKHFEKVIGSNAVIDQIRERDLENFSSYLQSNFADATVNSYIKSINVFMNFMRKKCKVELPDSMKEIKVETKLPKFLTPNELDEIYALCNDEKMLSTFKVYEHTGIRLRELHNCELDENMTGNYIKLSHTKGKRERIVPIPPEVVNDFKRAKFAPYKHDPCICGPYRADHISKTFTKLRKKAVLNRYAYKLGLSRNEITIDQRKKALKGAGCKTIHSLRHTFALRKLLEWGNLYLVSQALGHTKISTTQIYLNFPDGYLKDVFKNWIPEIQKNKLPVDNSQYLSEYRA